VVSNTSPLNYLVLIGEVLILPRLFGTVIIPAAVRTELTQEGAPQTVREFIGSSPEWLDVPAPASPPAGELVGGGGGEAVALAAELGRMLLVDDYEARRVAAQLGVATSGTLGVLERAAADGLLSLPDALASLGATNFRLAEGLIEAALERDRLRHEQGT